MPTTVGLQKKEVDVVTQAVKLELDCVGAYREAARVVQDKAAADTFEIMAKACQQHVDVWQEQLQVLGAPSASKSTVSEALNRYKVKVAQAFGLCGVARAVKNNPQDGTTAYKRVSKREDLSAPTRSIAAGFLRHAEQHLLWIEAMLHGDAPVPAER